MKDKCESASCGFYKNCKAYSNNCSALVETYDDDNKCKFYRPVVNKIKIENDIKRYRYPKRLENES